MRRSLGAKSDILKILLEKKKLVDFLISQSKRHFKYLFSDTWGFGNLKFEMVKNPWLGVILMDLPTLDSWLMHLPLGALL